MSNQYESSVTLMILIDFLSFMGGAERHLRLLSQELKKRGYKIIICCLKGGVLSEEMRNEVDRVEDLKVSRIYDYQGFKALLKIVRIIRKEKVQVMLSYHESSDYLGLLVALLTRVPIISSRRDMGFKLKFRHRCLYRLINRFFDLIVAVSAAVKEMVVKTQWVKPSNVTVIHNAVELLTNTNDTSGSLKQGSFLKSYNDIMKVSSIGNIRPIKGYEYFIDAANLVVKQFPNVHFFIVGKKIHSDPYYLGLCKRVKELNLENVFTFTGELQHSDVFRFLSTTDISVSSSLTEGMSNTLLESMALGKPVVATMVGGTPELVEDGKTGYLVPPATPDLMAEAILKLLSNTQLRTHMGSEGKKHVESLFNVKKMVDRHEDLIKYVYLRKRLKQKQIYRFVLHGFPQYLKKYAKQMIAGLVYCSGINFLFVSIKCILRKGKVKIICLHDISESFLKGKHLNISIFPETFSKMLHYLSANYKIVSLEEAVHLLKIGKKLCKDNFALTFDDCYKGWTKWVLPICKQHQLFPTFFVNTYPLDHSKPLLYDSLIFFAEHTWRKVCDLSHLGFKIFLLDNPKNIKHFIETIHDSFAMRTINEREQFLDKLAEYLGVSEYFREVKQNLLTWDELGRIFKEGAIIGSHTVSHPYMPALDKSESFWEINQSKRSLEENLGCSIKYFAYPYGTRGSYNHTLIEIVKETGFYNAFTLQGFNNRNFRPYLVGRRCINNSMFTGISDKFSKSLLAVEMSGFGDIIFFRFLKRDNDKLYG